MSKIPPMCKKCEKAHWRFQDCSHGKVFKRVGYDTLQQEGEYSPPRNRRTGYQSLLGQTEYRRTQGRAAPRVSYKED